MTFNNQSILDSNDIAVAQLVSLYGSVGWIANAEDPPQLHAAVKNSTYVLTFWENEILVALLRALSDNVSIAYVQDILVRPSHQRRGIATRLMRQFLNHFDHVRQIVLLTDNDVSQAKFYECLGLTNIKNLGAANLNTFVKIKTF